jgi:carbonic anhydrase
LASAEYGTAVLGASLIVVLGHNECGAIKATVDVLTKNAQFPGHLPGLISYLKPAVQQTLKKGGSLDQATKQNVIANVVKLQNSSPVISPLLKENKIRVVGAIYDLRSGRVEFLT